VGPSQHFLEVLTSGNDGNLAAAVATLDSDSLRKIPREKFRTKINKPRARFVPHAILKRDTKFSTTYGWKIMY
jgi:hypothetical protein